MSFSDTQENAVLDDRITAWTTGGENVYVSLHSASIQDDASASASEFTLGVDGYARVLHNAWTTAAAGVVRNTGAITFPNPAASWGTASHFALWSDPTSTDAADLLFHGTITPPRQIVADNPPSFAANALSLNLD